MIWVLVLVCLSLGLLLHLVSMHKKQKELLEAVKGMNQNHYQKLFVKGNCNLSLIALELNEVEQRHQEAICKMNRMEQANKELLTSLSHDVRTPLTSLMGYLEALSQGVVEGEEKQRYIQIARKKSCDIKELVDILFDWFKISSNEMKLYYESIDVCELTRQILITWMPILEKSEICCETSILDQEYFVTIDQGAYTRIVNNIFQNIVEHSECRRMQLSIEQQENQIAIIFEDDGIGIPSEQLEHVFERLYKGNSARSQKSSGLGLCIAKQLTEMMLGSIIVRSIQGQSTVFTVTFPRSIE
ncbi:sensor histidine kinase [Lachnotalea glycerini]|uniref:histidine kinase n=1 Tax=Lachnotalea glycerini TaxID=1763509 RepID=A0A371J778_9FIRM|nr:HAMP domain-containing sensor histidine kinase [Lachnotalea glycerini]RDY28609.1 sensor histidine kinase [Lachnotalea glycerini]